jgi:DNA-binding transcriptional LysR family regulator
MRQVEPACDLELRQLRAFVALIDRGSITQAAHSLKLAQSTVSEALAALERALGATVVSRRRGSRDWALTPAGQALLPNAREVLAAIDRTYVAIADAAAETRGVVDIVANESVSTYVLSQVLAHLRSRWPNTRFSVSVATCSEIRQGVGEGAFDVGLMLESADAAPALSGTYPGHQSEGCQVMAPAVPLVIFAAPAHPLILRKRREPTARGDLAGFSLFTSDAGGDFHGAIMRFLLEDNLPSARLHSTGSVEAVKRGVIADPHALGILPFYAIREEIRNGSVAQLNIRPAPPTMRLVALLPRSRARHPGTTQLIEGIRRVLIPPLADAAAGAGR